LGGVLSFIFHGLLAIVVFPFHFLSGIFSNPISWWIFVIFIAYTLVFQSGAKVRGIILGVYFLGLAGMGYVAHRTQGIPLSDQLKFSVFWPYWTYEMLENPLSQSGPNCFGTFNEPVPCAPPMSIAQ
jgi:hypothetical protein